MRGQQEKSGLLRPRTIRRVDTEVWLRPPAAGVTLLKCAFGAGRTPCPGNCMGSQLQGWAKHKAQQSPKGHRTSGDTLVDLHLHPVGEDGVPAEVIDPAGVELALLRGDGQIWLGGTRNLLADRLKGKGRQWAASPSLSVAAEGTSRSLLRAAEAGIPGLPLSSSPRDAGEGASPLRGPPQPLGTPQHPAPPGSCFPPGPPLEGQLHHRGQVPSLVPRPGPPPLPPSPGADRTTGTAATCVPRLCTAA